MDATSLTVTGRGNTINLGGSVGAVSISGSAKNTRLSVSGTVDFLLAAGYGSTISGTGKANSLELRAAGATLRLPATARSRISTPASRT